MSPIREITLLLAILVSLFGLSIIWLNQVNKYVPEPYLDEVFHIPQAQAYCEGQFGIWDPKITTPPGLYLISALLVKYTFAGSCNVENLRSMNLLGLLLLFHAAYDCRCNITAGKSKAKSHVDWDAVHSSVNICLFPPIFFFSSLYYTDVLSTCIVIRAYEFYSSSDRSIFSPFMTFLYGVLALLMRQTNIFWVAVFLAGLEVMRVSQETSVISKETIKTQGNAKRDSLFKYRAVGNHFQPKLADAEPLDLFWCAVDIAIALVNNLKLTLWRLWPYIALLVSFAGFVAWNGGVVLGDKSNHIATIHLPQMLYIWPFMSFFSLPLIYPYALADLLFSQPRETVKVRGHNWKNAWSWWLAAIVIGILIVHYNTIIHPFTLADNRHYIFYIFRYSIRRHTLAKYALVPIYVLCGFLVMRCLAGPFSVPAKTRKAAEEFTANKGHSVNDSQTTQSMSNEPRPETAFALVWLISTSLSLITAPLVEPRYFLIPWVIWRLNVPPLPLASARKKSEEWDRRAAERTEFSSTSPLPGVMEYWAFKGHDHRLWLETLWFLLISLITGYVFLFKGFEWPQEPGKVQRFMW